MLDQFLFGLHDRELQLKLFHIGLLHLPIDQAISTARTCETSKLLAEQLTTGASVQGIKSKSMYQKQKSAKIKTAAAAAAKTDRPLYHLSHQPSQTKPLATSVVSKSAPGHYCPTRNAMCRKCNVTGHFKPSATPKPKWLPSTSIKCPSPKTTLSQSQSRPEENQQQRYAHYQTPAQPSTPSHHLSTTANSKMYHSTSAYTPRPQLATTSSHSGPSKLKSTGKPTTDHPDPSSRPSTSWKPETTSFIKDNAAKTGNDPR